MSRALLNSPSRKPVLLAIMLASIVAAVLVEADHGTGLVTAAWLAAALISWSVAAAVRTRCLRCFRRKQASGGCGFTGSHAPLIAERTDEQTMSSITTPGNLCIPAADAVQFPVTLETLEEIGRLVSMNRDLDTLIPAMISTAKASLRCGDCRVYLRDAARQALVDPLASAPRNARGYVPRADYGIGAWIFRNRTLWTRGCDSEDADLQAESSSAVDLPDAVAPLTAGGDLLGLLVVERMQEPSPHQEQMLNTLANIYGLGIKNAQLFRRVEEMARRDGLTGLYNHTTFHEELRSLVRIAVDQRSPLSLVMSDIDFFKNFNDRFGHQVGDEVLREFARLWKAALPRSAVLARYGGEEFIAALPGVELSRAVELAEFLRRAVAEHPFASNGHHLQVTASFGVAELVPGMHTADELVRVADRFLYAAKKAGRNVVASDAVSAAGVLQVNQ